MFLRKKHKVNKLFAAKTHTTPPWCFLQELHLNCLGFLKGSFQLPAALPAGRSAEDTCSDLSRKQDTNFFKSTRHLKARYTCQPRYTHSSTEFESGPDSNGGGGGENLNPVQIQTGHLLLATFWNWIQITPPPSGPDSNWVQHLLETGFKYPLPPFWIYTDTQTCTVVITLSAQETKVFKNRWHLKARYVCQPKYTHKSTQFESRFQMVGGGVNWIQILILQVLILLAPFWNWIQIPPPPPPVWIWTPPQGEKFKLVFPCKMPLPLPTPSPFRKVPSFQLNPKTAEWHWHLPFVQFQLPPQIYICGSLTVNQRSCSGWTQWLLAQTNQSWFVNSIFQSIVPQTFQQHNCIDFENTCDLTTPTNIYAWAASQRQNDCEISMLNSVQPLSVSKRPWRTTTSALRCIDVAGSTLSLIVVW